MRQPAICAAGSNARMATMGIEMTAEVTTVSRTSKGLVDALFDAIDGLNQKKIDPEHARAVAHTARTIVSVAELELEFIKLKTADDKANLRSIEMNDSPQK